MQLLARKFHNKVSAEQPKGALIGCLRSIFDFPALEIKNNPILYFHHRAPHLANLLVLATTRSGADAQSCPVLNPTKLFKHAAQAAEQLSITTQFEVEAGAASGLQLNPSIDGEGSGVYCVDLQGCCRCGDRGVDAVIAKRLPRQDVYTARTPFSVCFALTASAPGAFKGGNTQVEHTAPPGTCNRVGNGSERDGGRQL